ncbi:MAG: hypothetical protein WC435_00885 [Candidatus Paceibacterota bacterium]
MSTKSSLIVLACVVLAVLGWGYWQKGININKEETENEKSLESNIENNEKNYAPIFGNINKIYQGEVTMSDSGVKIYHNDYWGIEFSFSDPNNKIEIVNDNSNITLRSKDMDPYNGTYIYLTVRYFEDKYKSLTLRQYIEETQAWDFWQESGKLVSIKEVKNENNINSLEVIVDYDYGKISRTRTYFIEYAKYGKGYIHIINAEDFEIGRQILSSFHFIK